MAVRDRLIQDTEITENTPLFAIGFSGGSMFAPVFTQLAFDDGWDVRAFSSHNTGPKTTAPVPSVFIAHANDNPNGLVNAYDDQAKLGYPTTLYYLDETLLDPLRFTKEPNITEAESIAFFDELVGFGLVDEHGQRLVGDDVIGQALDWFNRNSIYDDSSKARHQLNVLWRKHVFSADRACAEAETFEAQL
jgi:hypothetical protein